MRKKSRVKYVVLIFVCLSIFVYGFIKVNINKPELVRKRSWFTMDLKVKPFDFRIETKEYVFYVNNKVFDNLKEKYTEVYNGIFSR